MVDSHKQDWAGTEIKVDYFMSFKVFGGTINYDKMLDVMDTGSEILPVDAVATGGHIKLSTLSMLSLFTVNGSREFLIFLQNSY